MNWISPTVESKRREDYQMSAELRGRAIALSQAGKQPEARELLVQVITADVHDEIAWVWYAHTLPTNAERIEALEECLYHNPNCAAVQNRVADLKSHRPPQEERGFARPEDGEFAHCTATIGAEATACGNRGGDPATPKSGRAHVVLHVAPRAGSRRSVARVGGIMTLQKDLSGRLERSISRRKGSIAAAWEIYVGRPAVDALTALARIIKKPHGAKHSGASTHKEKGSAHVAEHLGKYQHPMLRQVAPSVRSEFALALTQQWRDSGDQMEYSPRHRTNAAATPKVLREIAPFATIIGTGYILDIDPQTLGDETYGDGFEDHDEFSLPAPYAQHTALWPELSRLPNLSIAARGAFIRTIQYTQVRSGLADLERINPHHDRELESGINELSAAGIVDTELGPADLLMNLTLRELREFALDEGVRARGSKHSVATAIAAQVSPEKIRTRRVSSGCEGKYVRPLISNLPTFKKYIWTEVRRLDLYLQWIVKVDCLRIPPQRYTREEKIGWDTDHMAPDPLDSGLRTKEQLRQYLSDRRNKIDIDLVRQFWDSECDRIVRKLAQRYAWYVYTSFRLVDDAIGQYLPAATLESFQEACEANGHYSPAAVRDYGSIRLHQMGIRVREPHLLECRGCGRRFKEWSVGAETAARLSYDILFCNTCSRIAVWRVDCVDAASISDVIMLERLAEFAAATEMIPLAHHIKTPELADLTTEKKTAAMRALLAMPSLEAYQQRFGPWLNALIMAGVLEDGTHRTARGTRCIAQDGHECFSLGEKTIDDWLSSRGIAHEKEVLYRHDFHLNPSGQMRADWRVGDTLIEFAGMMVDPEYAAKIEAKRELASKSGLALIIIEPEHMAALDTKLRHLEKRTSNAE